MKQIILTLSIIFLHSSIFCQLPGKLINNSDKLLKQKKYIEAIENLNNAILEIETLYLNEIQNDLLPKKIYDFVQIKNQNENTRSFINGNKLRLSAFYVKVSDTVNSDNNIYEEIMRSGFSITVCNTPEKLCEISNLYLTANERYGNSYFEAKKTLKYNGYRAILQFNNQQGRFAVIIGSAVLEVIAENIENETLLSEAAGKISIEKIIKYFGR